MGAMTDDDASDTPPTRQAIAAEGRSKKLSVTGKLKIAIDAMLYEGACRPDAAAKAGLKDHSVREAMRKPHVLAYYHNGLHVLRTSERPKNILALIRIRDGSDNGVAVVNAVKALELMAEEDAQSNAPGRQSLPGLVVQINMSPGSQAPTIDVTPDRKRE
jgi:hypothetical protein